MATKYEVKNGPSKWDLMLSLFDPQFNWLYPYKSERFISFGYIRGGKYESFDAVPTCLGWVDVGMDRFWKLDGYIVDRSRPFIVTDYNTRTRQGFVEFLFE